MVSRAESIRRCIASYVSFGWITLLGGGSRANVQRWIDSALEELEKAEKAGISLPNSAKKSVSMLSCSNNDRKK